jgi:hypothetical protein
VLFISFFLSTALFAQSKWDYKADSLFVVWGAKNCSGREDCSAEARMRSTDSSVIVEVEVTDDKLVFTDDPLNSDHIELWFALPNVYREYIEYDPEENYCDNKSITSYLYNNKSYVYLYEDTCDLEAFKNEITSPRIVEYIHGKKYSYGDISRNQQWLKKEIDKYLDEARSAVLKKRYVFCGITHLGVLPKSNKTVMYDKEAYDILEKQVSVSVPDYSEFINVESQIVNNGYRVKIILPPQAFGFVTNYGLKDVLFLINVIDRDESSKQETLISTSNSQKWGDPLTFNKVGFQKDMHIPIFPQYQLFKKENKYFCYTEFFNSLAPVFMYTIKGWVPIKREYLELQCDIPDSMTEYRLPYIRKIQFMRGDLSYKTRQIGKHTIACLKNSDMEYTIIDSNIYSKEDLTGIFLLPDSSLGLITVKTLSSESGYTSRLFLNADNKETQLAVFECCESMKIKFTENIKVTDQEWDQNIVDWPSYGNVGIDWKKLYKLDSRRRFLIFNLGNNQHIKIRWNDHGRDIKYSRM